MGIKKLASFEDFVCYLQTMEIYGSGYEDDVDYIKYNKRNSQSHFKDTIENLKKINDCYDLIISTIRKQEREGSQSYQVADYIDKILPFFLFQRYMFHELLKI